MKRKGFTIVGGLLMVTLGILLFACAGRVTSSPINNTPDPGTTPVVASNSPDTANAPAVLIPFGAAHGARWSNGVEAAVLSVSAYRAGTYSAGYHTGDTAVKVTVKVANNSTSPLDLSLAQVDLKAGPDGVQCDNIIDSEANVGMGFSGTIQPGRSATAVFAFSVPKSATGQLDVEVQPTYDLASATFEGRL